MNLHKKSLAVITWRKKLSSNKVIPITYLLGILTVKFEAAVF